MVVSVIVLAALGAMSIGSVAVLRTLRRESLYQKRILQAEALAELGIQDYAVPEICYNPCRL